MNISVSKKEIFNEVEKRSSLEGSILPDRYDGVWANADRGALLDSYWVEGCEAVVQLLKKYITSSTVEHTLNTYDSDEKFTVSATMSSRFNTLLEGSIATDIKMLIACNVLARWLEVSVPEASVKYKEESAGYSEELRAKLLYRISPTNTAKAAVADSEKVADEESALKKGEADSESVSVKGESLKKGMADSESFSREEAVLSKGKSDDEKLGCKCYDYFMYPENDDVPLVQGCNCNR